MKRTGSAVSDAGSALKCELAAEVLRSFGTLRFEATGWSMLPTVWPGDRLVVERVDQDQVQIGDVVLVGGEGRLRAHRVVSAAEDSGNRRWITRGDAMPAPDRLEIEHELLGRVSYLTRAGKRIALPPRLSLVHALIARVVSRSLIAARALVYFHRMFQGPQAPVLPCQG
jgi:signal peptidase I